jgi:hypothetical protein
MLYRFAVPAAAIHHINNVTAARMFGAAFLQAVMQSLAGTPLAVAARQRVLLVPLRPHTAAPEQAAAALAWPQQ